MSDKYKIIVVGDENVGKTSLIHLYTKGYYTEDYNSTIGVDLNFKDLCFNEKNMRLFIWDITGQERFRFLTKIYYQNVSGLMSVFDVNNQTSFYNCEIRLRNIYEKGSHLQNNILIGNKSDKEKTVNQEESRLFMTVI